ncbi:MAG: collagenase-like protease, partial [Prevotellaceae bacterium]|nr:collagenase-like protease [Prevotellaceae bacterium]
DYRGNVSNHSAAALYEQRGVSEIAPAFEISPQKNVPLMTCKHCIKYEMGWCARQKPAHTPDEPLSLVRGSQRFHLEFDCTKCEMLIFCR